MKSSLLRGFTISLAFSACALAQNGTWIQLSGGNASGSWQTAGNWSGGTIASGANNTANFSTLDITALSIVTLDAPTTIGNLTFADTTPATSASWRVSNAGNASNTLTLNGSSPTITVGTMGTGANVTIDVVVAGSNPIAKDGAGTLVLGANNTFTGAFLINQGVVVLGANGSLGTTGGNTTIASGATLSMDGRNVGGETIRLSGSGVGGQGALVNNSGANAGGVRLELLGAATVGGTGRTDTAFSGSAISGGNFTLTKTGTGIFAVNSGTVTNLGNVDIQQGTFTIVNNTGALDSATFGFSVASGANFTLFHNSGGAMTINRSVTLSDNGSLRSSSSLLAVTLSGNVSLTSGTANIESVTSNATHVNNFIISGVISGAGGFNKTGTANLTLTGVNTYLGNTTVTAGTLRVNHLSLPGNVTNNSALIFDQTTNGTYSGIISGNGTIEKVGTGSLTLGANNTFTGAAVVSQGTLVLGNNGSLGTTAGNTTVASGATLDLNGRNVGTELIRISGTGIGGAGALVNLSGNASSGQGNFALSLLDDATIGGTGRMDTAFAGTVIASNGFTLSKNGSNSLVINGATTLHTFNINQGSVVAVNNASALGNASFSANVASGASLQLFNSGNSTISHTKPVTLANNAELAGTTATSLNALTGNVTLSGGNATIRVEASGTGTLRLDGSITGAGGFNKTSAGTLLLTGSSDYTGSTTVTGGALIVTGALTGTSGVSVLANATLGGNGSISGPVTVSGILAPGTSPGTLTVNNALALNSSAVLNWEINVADQTVGGGINDLVTGVTNLTLDGTINFTLIGGPQITTTGSWRLFNYTGTLTNNILDIGTLSLASGLSASIDTSTSGQVNLNVIPEPSAWALLAAALTSVVVFRRRRTSAR